jgi:hypothetical protein
MPTDTQLLKAYGHLRGLGLSQVAGAQASARVVEDVLADERFCGHPDILDEEIADAKVTDLVEALDMSIAECEWLSEAHRRMAFQAGWPIGCYADRGYPNHHAATVYVDRDSFPPNTKRDVEEQDLQDIVNAGVWNAATIEEARFRWATPTSTVLDVALRLVFEAVRRIGFAAIEVDTDADDEHNIHIRSRPIPGSTSGIAWFPNGSCGDHVNHHIDSTLEYSLNRLSYLLSHELGHNLGFPHTFTNQQRHQSVMSYNWPRFDRERPWTFFSGFRTEDMPGPLPNDATWPQIRENYSPFPVLITDEPPGPTVPPGPTIVTTFSERGATYQIVRMSDDSPDLPPTGI